jgi:hypothetical protein
LNVGYILHTGPHPPSVSPEAISNPMREPMRHERVPALCPSTLAGSEAADKLRERGLLPLAADVSVSLGHDIRVYSIIARKSS